MASSLKQIAEKYHISVATLSRVINHKEPEKVSEKTRKRVFEILEKEHYVPNNIARSLRVNNTKTVGILVPDVRLEFFDRIIRSIENKLSEQDYMIMLADSQESIDKEAKYLELMLAHCVDALVMAPVNVSREFFPESLIRRICHSGTPIVFIDSIPSLDEPVDSVLSDDYEAGEKIARYFASLGHKKAAVITGDQVGFSPMERRLKGYSDVCRELGMDLTDARIRKVPFLESAGYEAMTDLLDNREKEPFTCLAVMSELMMIGALRALQDRKVQIGEDISLVGCDLNHRLQLLSPQITGVEQPVEQIGQTVAELLIGRLNVKQNDGVEEMLRRAGQRVFYSSTLIARESCIDLK